MTDTANTTYEGGPEPLKLEGQEEEVAQQVRTIGGPRVMEEYAELLAREIRAHFPEKRLGEVVALTKEQVKELLIMEFDVENDGEMEQMRELLVRKKAGAPSLLSKEGDRAKTDAGVFELASIETSKFTTRSFDEKLVSFVGKVSKRIIDVLRENQLITGTRQDERAMEHVVKRQVSANISGGLEILDKSIHLQNFLEDRDDESTPEERFEAINAIERQRGIQLTTLYHRLYSCLDMVSTGEDITSALSACRSELQREDFMSGVCSLHGQVAPEKQKQYMEQIQRHIERLSYGKDSLETLSNYERVLRALLEDTKKELLELLAQYSCPYYLFQTTDILLRDSNRLFLEWYKEIAPVENMSEVTSDLMKELHPTKGSIFTATDFSTIMRRWGIPIKEKKVLERKMVEEKDNALLDLLCALGHVSKEERKNTAEIKRVLKKMNEYGESSKNFLEGVQSKIIELCNDNGIQDIPLADINMDIENRVKRTNILEQLSIVNDAHYSVHNRFGSQVLAVLTHYMALVAKSDLYNKAMDVRSNICLGEVGELATKKKLYRTLIEQDGKYIYSYSNSPIEGNTSEELHLRFWNENGSIEEGEYSLYFLSPSSIQTKSIESIVMKLVVPNNVTKVADIFDMVRDSYDLIYTKKEIQEHPELLDRIHAFVQHIGEDHMYMEKKTVDQHIEMKDVRKQLSNDQYMIINKLTNEEDKSSSLYSTIKLYGRIDGVGVEVQFRPLDTVIVENTQVASHDYYETTRWINYMLELFPYSIYPAMHTILKRIKSHRAARKAIMEESVQRDYEQQIRTTG